MKNLWHLKLYYVNITFIRDINTKHYDVDKNEGKMKTISLTEAPSL